MIAGGAPHSNQVEVRVGNKPSISSQHHFIGRTIIDIYV